MTGIPHPLTTKVNGRTWSLFSAHYKSSDGVFCFYFYAIDFEHASYMLEELKSTATLDGKVDSIVPAEDVP